MRMIRIRKENVKDITWGYRATHDLAQRPNINDLAERAAKNVLSRNELRHLMLHLEQDPTGFSPEEREVVRSSILAAVIDEGVAFFTSYPAEMITIAEQGMGLLKRADKESNPVPSAPPVIAPPIARPPVSLPEPTPVPAPVAVPSGSEISAKVLARRNDFIRLAAVRREKLSPESIISRFPGLGPRETRGESMGALGEIFARAKDEPEALSWLQTTEELWGETPSLFVRTELLPILIKYAKSTTDLIELHAKTIKYYAFKAMKTEIRKLIADNPGSFLALLERQK
jgi:hypothetical protein